MKEYAKSNIYDASERIVRELYADYLDGPASTLVCAIANHPLSPQAQKAVESSMSALGYGKAVTRIVLTVDEIALSDQDLFMAIEGIDPLAIVAADAMSTQALAKAYRCELHPDSSGRLLGRNCVAFRNLEGMLASPEQKQRAWALFKQLPKLKR